MASKSSTLTSTSMAGRLMPALLTRMSNGSAAATAACAAEISVTARVMAPARSPRLRMACAAASISAVVRAASVTCAPACASAEAAASPMPRPPPVTSARLPSSRNDGVFVSSIEPAPLIFTARFGEVRSAVPHVRSAPSPRSYGERVGVRGGGLLDWFAPHPLPLPAPRAGGGSDRVCRPVCASSLSRLGIGDVAAAVTPHAHIGLLGVSEETFEHAQPGAIFADQRGSLVGEHLLVGARLEEFADPEAAGVARRFFGRQGVVGPDHLVAVGDVRAGAEKERAVVAHVRQKIIGIARHHLHVLGGDAVGLAHHLVESFAHDHLAEVRPCLAGDLGGGKDCEQPLEFAQGVACKLFGIGDEDRGGGWAMLRLAEKIGGAELPVGAVVGNDQGLGRSRQEVDADPAEQL